MFRKCFDSQFKTLSAKKEIIKENGNVAQMLPQVPFTNPANQSLT